jgi:hypothetical protein
MRKNNNTCRPVNVSQEQNAGQNHSRKIDNISFERMEQFRYMGTTVTNRNSIHEEINA